MSYYTSLTGLKNAQTQLGVISHNIANSETSGFKKSSTAFSDIVAVSLMSDPKKTMGVGTSVAAIQQNFSIGAMEQTGSALDLAINGDGFFSVVSPLSGEVSYTRAGAFSILDANGYIQNNDDQRLQLFPVDADGNITSMTTTIDAQVPTTNADGAEFAGITVGNDGSMVVTYADGTNETIGVVALASFIGPQGLKQQGSASWTASGLSGDATLGQPGEGQFGSLQSGMLERSNVDIADELVGLITAQRYFQANAKAIDTATQIGQTIINLRT